MFPKITSINGKRNIGFINKSNQTTTGQTAHSSSEELCLDIYVCATPYYCTSQGGCDYLNCPGTKELHTFCELIGSICSESGNPTISNGIASGPSAGNSSTGAGGSSSTPPDPCGGGGSSQQALSTTPRQSGIVVQTQSAAPCNGSTGWSPAPSPGIVTNTVIVQNLVTLFSDAGNNLSQSEINWLTNNPSQATDLLNWMSDIQSDESIDELNYFLNNTAGAKMVIDEEINSLANGPYDDNYTQVIVSPNLPLPSVIPIGSYCARWAAAYTGSCIMLKLAHPDWSSMHVRFEALRYTIQLGLDVIGLMPVVGAVANLTNATIYYLNGEGMNGTLSVLASVPIAGWVTAGAKAAFKGENLMIKATDGFIKFSRDQNSFRKALGLVKGDGLIAHHVIPFGLSETPLVQKAAEGGFHINDVLNGLAVTSIQQAGSHPQYDAQIAKLMQNIIDSYGGISNISPGQALNEITNLANRIKNTILNNPNVALNNLSL